MEDLPVPEPAEDDLLVRVLWSTVNRTDCAYRAATPWFMRAVHGWRRPRHPVGGTEFSGVVESVGAGVRSTSPGDRVFGYAEGRFGAHAEYVAVAEGSMVARSRRASSRERRPPRPRAATTPGRWSCGPGCAPGRRSSSTGRRGPSGPPPCSCSSTTVCG